MPASSIRLDIRLVLDRFKVGNEIRMKRWYPLAGFRCIGILPSAAQVLTVPRETPRISAASATLTYSLSLGRIHPLIDWSIAVGRKCIKHHSELTALQMP